MKKLHGYVIRTLLIIMGVPISQQSASSQDRLNMLNALAENEPQKYKDVYDIVVNGVDPRSLGKKESALPGLIAATEIAHQVKTTFTDYMIDNDRIIKSRLDFAIDQLSGQQELLLDHIRSDAMKAIIEESKKFRRVEVKVGSKPAKKINFTAPAVFDDILDLAANRINILLTGPAGCGKTFIAEKVSEALDLDFSSQSCSEGMSESALTGWLLPVGQSGQFSYISSEFIRIYENGGVFLFDEMDASDPNVLVFMNKSLANGSFYLPQRYKKPKVTKHPDFVAIAATNTFGHGGDTIYVGRNQLDAATLDRFKIGTVVMDYDDDVEESLIGDEILDWGRTVRSSIKNHKVRRIMSTRVMIDATKMALAGWSLEKIKNSYYSDWSRAEVSMIGGRI